MTNPNCTQCGADVGDDPHMPHQPGCTQPDGCWCDTVTYCPACCPTCNEAHPDNRWADLSDRAERHLDLIHRRGGTGVPGTVSLIRDLVAALNGPTTTTAEQAVINWAIAYVKAQSEGASFTTQKAELFAAVAALLGQTDTGAGS